jgi:hypothetical protein
MSPYSSRRTHESLAIALVLGIGRCFVSCASLSPAPPTDTNIVQIFAEQVADPESILSVGRRLNLEHLDMYSLELIPNVSDTLARNILERHREIIEMARTLRPGQKHRAFEIAPGVGLKTAKELGRSIDMSSLELD